MVLGLLGYEYVQANPSHYVTDLKISVRGPQNLLGLSRILDNSATRNSDPDIRHPPGRILTDLHESRICRKS